MGLPDRISALRERYLSGYVLSVLVLVNVTCECFRYLFNYLSAVSTTSQCKDVCDGLSLPSPWCDASGADHACGTCRAHYSILDGSCITRAQYGVLAGPAFAILYACFGLFAGRAADALNRRVLHTTAIIMWSVAVLCQGFSRAFWHMLLARLLLGVAESFQAPCSYSVIAERFDMSYRSRANGIYSFGIYMGGGAASLSILLAKHVGWRRACFLYGLVGVSVGVLYGATVKGRSKDESPPTTSSSYVMARHSPSPSSPLSPMDESGFGEQGLAGQRPVSHLMAPLRMIVTNRKVLLLILASSIRFYAGNSIGAFLPIYIGRAFPSENAHYSLFNALIICFGGAISAYLGGLTADLWAKSSPRALALVPALGSFLAVLPFAGVVFSPGSFGLSMICLLIEYLLAECWLGPALTILQESLPTEVHGLGVGVFLFVSTMVGELAPVTIGQLDSGDARGLAVVLFWNVASAYVISGVVFVVLGVMLHHGNKAEGETRLLPTDVAAADAADGGGDDGLKAPVNDEVAVRGQEHTPAP